MVIIVLITLFILSAATYCIAHKLMSFSPRDFPPIYPLDTHNNNNILTQYIIREAANGLSAALLASLPIVQFAVAASKGTLTPAMMPSAFECAVCLSEFREGEGLRAIPVCGHCFHVACIDMWLFAHSTCPICRLHLPSHLPLISQHEPPVQY
ncbi:hypothetical protein L7F22_047707 [Adiantum nelumboides]|nr:hypothetical protein [Adiantum nelumboides]